MIPNRYDDDDPVQFGPKQLVSATKLVRNLSGYLNLAKKKPIFIERDQEVEAVIINIEDYRNLLFEEQKTKDLYFTISSLRKYFESTLKGEKMIPLDEFLEMFNLKYLMTEDLHGV